MSITRKELADIFTGIWYEDDDETTAESHLRMVDAAIAALDAADKITPELPEGWFDKSTPRPEGQWIEAAWANGQVHPVHIAQAEAWSSSWQLWRPLVLSVHPTMGAKK